jgi:hypothetical protein
MTLSLDPSEAWSGARALAEAGQDLTTRRDTTGAAIAAASAAPPWGGDEAGRAFESRYRALEAQVLGAWAQLGDYVESLGDAVSRAVRDDVDADRATARRLDQP